MLKKKSERTPHDKRVRYKEVTSFSRRILNSLELQGFQITNFIVHFIVQC